ncbi:lipopolysaccharide biosynthesis protein [Vibrio navarrensis]|uniref:Lipopolysaccharide biosynthesis protein n=1 Tax=Vibrio navarrensis TaxID=29495 RepID=A0A099LRP3_9VIBR|nr:lipopolysaccharide biosynthesis protein [Vibrio navarrensis]KGK10161.1 lipopolysaccharide biosynthesis protein [Vibrio navarrensis]MBE4616482.1 lipopolysaccharide biosynthesis protein [Vibrio navarrensis]QOD69860.1 lipopolysaccharide biosynthesis protein [Vibrio navarrensis]
MSSLKQKATTGLKWSAIERLATQAVQLLVMLLLARQLGPQAFGLVGMLAVFIAISQVFVDSGMTSALIRKLDRTEADFSTAFYFNIVIAVICYALLYLTAPSIARFYQQPELIELARVLGLVIMVNAFAVIQKAKLTIVMDFKTQAKASLLSVLLSSFVALITAHLGFGVWALVVQTLTFAISNVLLLNYFHFWWPNSRFSRQSFNDLFGFGSKLLLSGLIDSLFQNIYQLVIGKQFSATDVGYFTQANQLVRTPATTMVTIIQKVTYPLLSGIQREPQRLNCAYLLIIRLAAVVSFPLLIGLATTADILLPLVLGEQWQPAVILVSILSIGFLLYPIHSINLNYLQVKGRSDLFLKLEIIKKIITTLILFITVPYGVTVICIGMVVQSYLALVINTYYNGKLGNLGLIKQLQDLLPIGTIAVFVCISGKLLVIQFISNPLLQLILIGIYAIPSYIILIKMFQPDLYQQILSMLQSKTSRPS